MEISEEERKLLPKLIERRLAGKQEHTKFSDLEKKVDTAIQKYREKLSREVERKEEKAKAIYAEIDLNSTNQTFYRSVGLELICDHFWRNLQFDSILSQCNFSRKEKDLAKTIIFGRLISPGSELHTMRWFFNQSSLLEMLLSDLSEAKRDSFYEISDLLYVHKTKIEDHLRQNTKKLFSYRDTIYLYDLTNTYFEGRKQNSNLCFHGKSKEKRSDCPLVTLALVVDQNGFPKYSRIYKGNQSEPLTLKATLNKIYSSSDNLLDYLEKPSIAMDRGIATKDNIQYLKDNNYSYFIIERRDAARDYKEEFSNIIQEGKKYKTRSGQTIYLKKKNEKDCVRVLVYSVMKSQKEDSIIGKRESRFFEDLAALIKSNKNGYIKDKQKILIRLGRLKERYGAIANLYNITLENDSKKGYVSRISFKRKLGKISKKDSSGCYVIETDNHNYTAEEIWEFYMNLNEVESAFRSFKTDLGTRPVYHRRDSRIESHLFISVLAYSILKSIIYSLNQKGYKKSWKLIKEILSNHMRGTTIQQSKSGEIYNIRVNGIPEKEALIIYKLLDMKIRPERKIKKQKIHL
ncbi:MAG: IS1634 family transposase [Candidatus Cloacimonadota bacterium]|nr:IS1634 family transposase [Candidatus Cloacimonadota bacterium]